MHAATRPIPRSGRVMGWTGFDDLVMMKGAPPNRAGMSPADSEHHLYEGAVMVACTMHLLRSERARIVTIHPDGEHGKQFDFRA